MTDKTFLKKYVSRKEAAARFGISIRKLDYLIEAKIIPAARFGPRCLRINLEKADAAVEALEGERTAR